MSNSARQRVLFIMPLPPPVHGSSMMCQHIVDSERINAAFDCRYVNLSTSRSSAEPYNFSPLLLVKKALRFAGSLARTLGELVFHHPQTCYLAITCHGVGFLKDAPFVLLCKLFRCRIIIHQHNKGMAAYARRPLYHFLLRLVYRGATVILLSWRLYDDVAQIVDKEQVVICPNGI